MSKMKVYFVKFASKFLMATAAMFAMSLCSGRMYEPEVPEELRDIS